MWGEKVYIINGRVTRKNLDDRLNRGYSRVYAVTTVVILYWNPDQTFSIRIAHHAWFDEYDSCLSMEYYHNLGSLILQQYTESLSHNLDLLNLILC